MKKFFLLLLIGLAFFKTYSQADSLHGYIKPQYTGGRKGLCEYLNNYLNYPPIAREMGIESNLGAVVYISKAGKVKFVNVLGKEKEFKPQVKKILSLMPDWTSGKLNGKAIDTSVVVSICFSLQRSRIKGDTNICEIISYSVSLDGRVETKEQKDITQEKRKKYTEGKALYEKAIAEVDKTHLSQAIDLFNQAELSGYKTINLYYNRGVAYNNSHNKEFACNDWTEAARMGSEEAYALYLNSCKEK